MKPTQTPTVCSITGGKPTPHLKAVEHASPPEQPGKKFDKGKPTFELLPDDALAGIQKVLDFGAKKYNARNWEKGMNWTRPWNATMRHLWAWMRGEKVDAETGLSPLLHAGCEILFLIAYEMRGVGKDDRPKPITTEVEDDAFCSNT